ncbi:MAG: vWA domain-containing protein [Gammaproteobacteria bacterium]
MKIQFARKIFPLSVVVLSTIIIAAFPYINHARLATLPAEQPAKSSVLNSDEQRPEIEVVFVLDTTSSMSGLIQAAKDNIWSIASTMAAAKPAPRIKMGLVAFRDRGDQYVTKVFNLSEDLDGMYATLMDFAAQGGGDGPESVNQALHDAVTKISWSDNPANYKVMFLVGDAPPHMDYHNDVKYPTSIALATKKGIIVNTIQAGHDANTARSWEKIASLSQGVFFNVAEQGSHVAVATPFDTEIATLSEELDQTRYFYGTDADKKKNALKAAATEKLHALASVATRAKRAMFNASESGTENFSGNKELVADVVSGALSLDEISEAELPAAIRALPSVERKREIDRQAKKRASISAKIADLAKRRDEFVAGELAKADDLDRSLDQQIYETVAAQAKEKGLRYEGGPKY